jgi:hypothetical protein
MSYILAAPRGKQLTLEEQEGDDGNEGDEHGVSVSKAVRSPTGNLETENLADLTTCSKRCLPLDWDLVRVTSWVEKAESLDESGLGVELSQEQGVVPLRLSVSVSSLRLVRPTSMMMAVLKIKLNMMPFLYMNNASRMVWFFC